MPQVKPRRRPPGTLGSDPFAHDAAAGHEAPAEPLDRERLVELQRVLGSARVEQLLALFAGELAARPGAIRLAIGQSDFPAAGAQAHNLKGAARSIGGQAVGDAAAAIEQVLASRLPAQAERLHAALLALDRAVASTLAALPGTLRDFASRAA